MLPITDERPARSQGAGGRVVAILACLAIGAFAPEAAVCRASELFPEIPRRTIAPAPDDHTLGAGPSSFPALPPANPDFLVQDPPTWTLLPEGLLYRSYVAGEKESRFSTAWLYDTDDGWWWDSTLGGRAGVARFDPGWRGDGTWQLDIEGAAMVRLDMTHSEDLQGVDFRFGVPLTWRDGPVAFKTGYYHVSSHVGDEFLLRTPGFERINYVRESLVFGVERDLGDEWMVYAETGYAFKVSGGAKPLEFQFGAEYEARPDGWRFAAPFAAVNIHLRQEVDFGGSVNAITGWRWSGDRHARTWRAGLQFFQGKSAQYSFFRRTETLLGLGLWYDY
ncbi:MAG: DUF1207 domain-containing protein [Planctomycetaceae bacterium]